VGPFGLDRGGLIDEEVVTAEAGIAFATLRVEDPEGGPPPRRAVAVAGDERFGPLAHDVASEADPRPPGEFEAQAGRLGDGGGKTAAKTRRFEDDEERLRTTGERRQPAEPICDPGRPIRGGQPAARQVQHEQVHRPPGEQYATDGQALVERLGRDDDEPLETDATRDGLDRVEAAREVEPGDDRTRDLRFGSEPQNERRPAARPVAADRDAGRPRQPTGAQDRVERREARVDDAVVVRTSLVTWSDIGEWRHGRRLRQRERSDDPRSCGTPPGAEARDSGVHFGWRGPHRTTILEHTFYG